MLQNATESVVSAPHRREEIECQCPIVPTIYDPVCAIQNDEVLEFGNACAAQCAYVSVIILFICFFSICVVRTSRSQISLFLVISTAINYYFDACFLLFTRNIAILSIYLSVRLSVRHTGGSVKNGAS